MSVSAHIAAQRTDHVCLTRWPAGRSELPSRRSISGQPLPAADAR